MARDRFGNLIAGSEGDTTATAPDLSQFTQNEFSPDIIQSKIRNSAQHYGVDPNFSLAIANQESSFNPRAINPQKLKSGGHAQGVYQFTPETAKLYGLDDPLNADKNIDAGNRFLADLNKQYHGDKYKMAVHFNSGPGNVDKPFEQLPDETQDYVTKVVGPNSQATQSNIQRDRWGNVTGGSVDVSKNPLSQPSQPNPTQQEQQARQNYFQTQQRLNVPGGSVAKEYAPFAPVVLGGVGGTVGGMFGFPNVGAGIGEAFGDVIKGYAKEGEMNPEIAKEAARNAVMTAGLGKLIDVGLGFKNYLKNRALKTATGKIESARQDLTGGIPSGSTVGAQAELEAKNLPVKQEEGDAWRKVYDRMDMANQTINAMSVDPATGKSVLNPVQMKGPIKLSKDTVDFIKQEKQRLGTVNQKFPTSNNVDAELKLNKFYDNLIQDDKGNYYVDFDSAKNARSAIGRSASQQQTLSVSQPGAKIGIQRGTAAQVGLRNNLENDISSSLLDIGGPDALNEYANAVGMTKKAVKANVFDKMMAKNTDYGTGNLNVDAALNDINNPTSKIGRQFTAQERYNISQMLQNLKKTSGYNGGLQFQNGRIIFNSVLAMGHPWRAAIAAKDLFERGMSDPKYARILNQLPAAPQNSGQAKMLTTSFFKGAGKSLPMELIAPSGMRVKAHIDENGEPKPDFQFQAQ